MDQKITLFNAVIYKEEYYYNSILKRSLFSEPLCSLPLNYLEPATKESSVTSIIQAFQ